MKNLINESKTEPSTIFPLINRGEIEKVKYLIDKKIVSINTLDNNNNDVLVRLLKAGEYQLVIKYMKKREWNVNNRNIEGESFGHILSTITDKTVIKVIEQLLKKKNFNINIINNNKETIFDKAIKNNQLLLSLKILEDKRFNNIDLYDFKKLFKVSFNKEYGSYSKLSNFNLIFTSLIKKELQPNMQILLNRINDNKESIIKDIEQNKINILSTIINSTIKEISV